MKKITSTFLGLLTLALSTTTIAQTIRYHPIQQYHTAAFLHPGILHKDSDLARMKQMVAAGAAPWKGGFEKLAEHPQSSANWKPQPQEHVERTLLIGHSKGIGQLEGDVNAAYQNALMWCITGKEAHAQKAIEILNAWSATLKVFDGTDIELGAGLCGFKFANAAELMRYTYPKWQAADIVRCQQMLRNIFYPPLKDFALWAHGNWDLCCMKTMMAIGIFCDDHAMFDKAVDFFYNGQGNGALKHYIVNENGQVQESGRDQPHTQLGIGQMAEICEMGWSQGLDMYSYADNRLLKGFEYVAKYNLGEDVPFIPYTDMSGRFTADKIAPRTNNPLRAIFEMVYNHYVIRKGIAAPWTTKAAESLRPEGAGFGADHPGFGTLLFTLKR
ncbi:MAG: alginate lyase family protein [Ferruginibacter sp.]